jgi:heat shock protein HslJ
MSKLIFLIITLSISLVLISGCTYTSELKIPSSTTISPTPTPTSILTTITTIPTIIPTTVPTLLPTAIQTTVTTIPTTILTTVPTPLHTPLVTVVTTAPLTYPALIGNWNFKGGLVAGGTMPAIPNVQITLKFNNDGTLSGFGGCNNYNAKYILTGQTTEFGKTITIGPLASTQMYCADASDLESRYLANLQDAKTYSIINNQMIIRASNLNQLSYSKV